LASSASSFWLLKLSNGVAFSLKRSAGVIAVNHPVAVRTNNCQIRQRRRKWLAEFT
jgi:hypothetical protein